MHPYSNQQSVVVVDRMLHLRFHRRFRHHHRRRRRRSMLILSGQAILII